MNRIFKVVWNETRNCYMVGSELISRYSGCRSEARNRQGGGLKKLLLAAFCGLTLLHGGPVLAAEAGESQESPPAAVHYFSVNPEDGNRDRNYLNDGAVGTDSLAVGAGAYADGTMGATALGNDAKADGERALAIGNGSRATGLDAIAIGTGSQGEANGTNAIAIGEQSHAVGTNTTAVGSYSEAIAEGAVALGQQAKSKGTYSTSIGLMANGMYEGGTAGDHSTAVGAYSKSSGLASTALGGFATATESFATSLGYASGAGLRGTAVGAASQATGEGGTAVGLLSSASSDGSVALGMSSVADREAGWQGYHPVYGQMQDASPAWQSSWGAVSVGAGPSQDENGQWIPQRTRQIINLAAGTEDTDAVNVAQLKEAMSDARISIHAGEGIIVEKLGSEYTIRANLNGLSNTHGEVQILSNPEEFTDDPEQPEVSPDRPRPVPAPRLSVARSVAEPETEDGGPVHVGYVANEVDFATDDGNTAKVNDGGTINVLGGDNIHTASSSTTDANGRTVDNIHIHLDKDITVDSVAIGEKGPTLNGEGMDMKGLSITGLAPGEVSAVSTDAVNGSQLYATNQMVEENRQNITHLGSSLNKLDARVNRVGAGAAALAALQPLDFNPDDKWDFAAGYGNYAGAHAVAIGAYYRPTEDMMFSVGGSFGGGENMVNAGVTFKLGQQNHVTRSKVAMAKEIIDLRATVEMLKNQNAQILQTLKLQGTPAASPLVGKFSDVPETHWAYQYVEELRKRGYLEGYPDGEFKGERTMTRYEYAAVIYRALQNGAPVDADMARSVEEFKPELTQIQEAERFRVDRISGKDNDRHKVERVRVNSENSKEKQGFRDVYGSRIQ
ncbi:YadA-like family protein [Acidaminococcus fermentans]|uniref:YadA-like family protein n=1 Tax=Acidaminococcus fermentans TaxID=905 RepID=UPI002430DDC2|nr:YadA-like family protein [Acidaminococcus fermentans]